MRKPDQSPRRHIPPFFARDRPAAYHRRAAPSIRAAATPRISPPHHSRAAHPGVYIAAPIPNGKDPQSLTLSEPLVLFYAMPARLKCQAVWGYFTLDEPFWILDSVLRDTSKHH